MDKQILKWPEIVWDAEIKRLVQTVLSIPIGSAEADRGFSTLKYLQDSRRKRLAHQTLNAMMRIKFNGPDILILDYFTVAKYADRWIKSGKYATDNPANKKKEDAIRKALSNSALIYERVFIVWN